MEWKGKEGNSNAGENEGNYFSKYKTNPTVLYQHCNNVVPALYQSR